MQTQYEDLTEREQRALAQREGLNQRLQFSSLEGIREGARGNLNRDTKRQEGKQNRAALVESSRLRAGGDARQGASMIQALENFKGDTDAYTSGGGDELGGVKAFLIEYGPEWVADIARKTQSAGVQGLMAQATALDTQLRELVTSGVLSDQDVRNLKPLSLGGTASADQIVTRADQIQQMISLRSGIPLAPSGGERPAASVGERSNVGLSSKALSYLQE